MNIIINNINKKRHLILIVILSFFFSFIPSFFSNPYATDKGYGIVSFVLLYFIGAFIAKYNKNKLKPSLCFLGYLISQLIVFFAYISPSFQPVSNYNYSFTVIGSIFLFLWFSKLNIDSKFINNVSKHVFAIYIIHMNGFINTFYFKEIFHCNDYYTSKFLVLNMIISVISIFIICLLIDVFKEYCFKIIKKIIKTDKLFLKNEKQSL